jgi:hypothetical protein
MTKTMDSAVKAVFSSYPEEQRAKLLVLRALILDTASEIEAVGELTETLKWGEPAYLTERSKSGSTIRIGWKKSAPTRYAMYFNCQTTLVDTFRTLSPELHFEGNRAVVFEENEELPVACVTQCITLALTYHNAKKHNRQQTQRG